MPNSNLSAPQTSDFPFIDSVEDRVNRGLSSNSAYIDVINGLVNQDYNLAMAEYLYNKYKSPAAMARQYEEAGINRNFASQSGGDVGTPSNNFKSSYTQSRAQSLQNTLSIINSTLGLITQGVETVSNLTNLPKDLAFKEWRNVAAAFDANIKDNQVMSSLMKAYYDQAYYGGVQFSPWDMNGLHYDIANSPAMNQASLRNALMELKVKTQDWDLNNLKPAQLSQINEMIDNVARRTSFLGLQEDLYSQLKAAGILAPIIVSLIKNL